MRGRKSQVLTALNRLAHGQQQRVTRAIPFKTAETGEQPKVDAAGQLIGGTLVPPNELGAGDAAIGVDCGAQSQYFVRLLQQGGVQWHGLLRWMRGRGRCVCGVGGRASCGRLNALQDEAFAICLADDTALNDFRLVLSSPGGGSEESGTRYKRGQGAQSELTWGGMEAFMNRPMMQALSLRSSRM